MSASRFPPPPHGRCPCKACGREMLFAHNIATRKTGTLDTKAPIYVLRLDLGGAGLQAQTSGDFLAGVAFVELADGKRIKPEELRFYVSHFATCSKPELFSKDLR